MTKFYKGLNAYKEKAIDLQDNADLYLFQLKQSEKRLTVRDQYDI